MKKITFLFAIAAFAVMLSADVPGITPWSPDQFRLGQCYLQEEGKYCDFVEAAAWFATAYHNESNDMTKAGMRIYNMICAHLDNAKRWDLQQKESNYKRLYSKK